jgi:diacyltrehalose acyltransferase
MTQGGPVAKHRTTTKHHTNKKRRTQRALVTAAAAVGLSGTLVLGHALDITAANFDVTLANTVLGVGGRGDATSANVPYKLFGDIGPAFSAPSTFHYVGISYPASFNFQDSVNQGVPALETGLGNAVAAESAAADPDAGDAIQITSYSEGNLVAEQVKRNLATAGYHVSPGQLTFLSIASPYVPNGGLFGRLPGFTIPGLVPTFSPAKPTDYNTTYVVNEYDPYADFPAYFNPLALANSALAIQYAHPDQYYDNIDPTAATGVYTTTVTNNGAGGTDTYILVHNGQLPLFGPIRQLEGAVPQLTPLVEPFVSGVEPLARVLIDMGYTDRENLNPATPTRFGLITPPAKVLEAAGEVPGALEQGVKNFVAGHDVTPPSGSVDRTQATPSSPAVEQVTTLNAPKEPKQSKTQLRPPKKTKAPGFGQGPGAKLLKKILGGEKKPKPERSQPDNTANKPSAAA